MFQKGILATMPETPGPQHCPPRISEVQRYIRSHLDEPLNRRVLAVVAGFSVPHLHRVFAQATGESISRYVRRVRLERAGLKLRAGAVDITQIALAAGYSNHSNFARAFRKQYGMSPSAFRGLGCPGATSILRGVTTRENPTDQRPNYRL